MAIFLGAGGGDILAWRGSGELVKGLQGLLAERMGYLLAGEGIELLRGVRERIEEELAYDECFSAGFAAALEELERTEDADVLSDLHDRFNRLAAGYFQQRGSVVALHSLCNSYRDALVRKALLLAEHGLALDGMGRPPAPYCWLAAESAGRLEQTFCTDHSYILIYGDTPDDDTGYFKEFVYRALASLERTGLVKNDGKSLWHGSRTAWRSEIVEEMVAEERGRFDELIRCADLRPIYGADALAKEMINVVWSMLEFHHRKLREASKRAALTSRTRAAVSFPLPALRDMGKGLAEMPAGLDFFSRLRVERSGRHRGEFDLEQFALVPLISKVRLLAISCAIHETSTIKRIKGLQGLGHLSVELAERLLLAYHDFTRLKAASQLKTGCEIAQTCFIDPKALTENEEQRLRNGLEAVSGLAIIAYLFFTKQG